MKTCKFCKAVKNKNVAWHNADYHSRDCERADKEGVNMRMFNYLQPDDGDDDFEAGDY